MLNPYKVLLPKWVFKEEDNEKQVQARAQYYMQRYPHYNLIRIENGFAICGRLEVDKKN